MVTPQDLTDTYLPAFHVCSRFATGFMCSYNAVNGVPSCANAAFLTDKLRKVGMLACTVYIVDSIFDLKQSRVPGLELPPL